MGFRAPFPWFGGKSRVAHLVWERFGKVSHYVEPFFGSGAVLFGRPGVDLDALPTETINDKDGFVANAWRAIAHDPEQVAKWCDWPVNEADLHARHCWLVERRDLLTERLMGDPDYFDAKIAGWWIWGINCWIGSGWCSGNGAWQSVEVEPGDRQLVHLGNPGRGVHRQLVHLGEGRGVHRQLVHLGNPGKGVRRQRVHLGDPGRGDAGTGAAGLMAWMDALAARLRRVRVCCGDWKRCCSSTGALFPIPGYKAAVFLDPPYTQDERCAELYACEASIADEVFAWCVEWGAHPHLRIALCGYEGEIHGQLVTDHGWSVTEWSAHGGFGVQRGPESEGSKNRKRERIWWSPGCLDDKQGSLFAALAGGEDQKDG